MTIIELTNLLIEFDHDYQLVNREFLERIVSVEQSRLKTLVDFKKISDFYFTLPRFEDKLLVFKKSSLEAARKGLEITLGKLSNKRWGNIDDFEKILSGIVKDNQLSNADVYWPVRVALSGKDKSPSPAELLWVLGKDESLIRINKALKNIS